MQLTKSLSIGFWTEAQVFTEHWLKGSVSRDWDGPNLVSEERYWKVRAQMGPTVDRCTCV